MKNRFFRFSKRELIDLGKAWLAISVAFAIVMNGLSLTLAFLITLAISALTVGVGFLTHELAHKLIAQRYGCRAEFRSSDTWLILAILMSFLGFIFVAPGGVYIAGHIDNIRNGRISAAGIIANILLAIVFLIVFIATPLKTLAYYGIYINALLALFNLIPIGNFDGKKVLRWNKKIYALLVITALIMMASQFILNI